MSNVAGPAINFKAPELDITFGAHMQDKSGSGAKNAIFVGSDGTHSTNEASRPRHGNVYCHGPHRTALRRRHHRGRRGPLQSRCVRRARAGCVRAPRFLPPLLGYNPPWQDDGGIAVDIRSLGAFRAVYECGSITKAAARMYISPQGLSKNIGRLEAELGTPPLRAHATGGVSQRVRAGPLSQGLRPARHLRIDSGRGGRSGRGP